MKRLLTLCLFALLTCFATSALAADAASLVGTWEGTPSVHGAKIGYRTGKFLVLKIVEQKGNVFHGTKSYHRSSVKKDRAESFSGSIDSAGQIFIADHDEGYMIGTVTKGGEMELQYGHRGKDAVVVHVLLKRTQP